MSDVRTLLASAAQGPARLAADPVGAVGTRIRRRAARRRTAVAAGTTAAVAAIGTVTLGGSRASTNRVTTRPAAGSTTPQVTATTSEAPRPPGSPRDPEFAAYFENMGKLAKANPTVFLALTEQGSDNELGWHISVAVAAGVDTAEWEARMREAAGPTPWEWKRCAATAARYDQVSDELKAFTWPSGAVMEHGTWLRAVDYAPHCQVEVVLSTPLVPAPEDVAAARTRWGNDALVRGHKPEPTSSPTSAERPRG